jgi:hypothetical protein
MNYDPAAAEKANQYPGDVQLANLIQAAPIQATPAYAVGTVAAPPGGIYGQPYGQQPPIVHVQQPVPIQNMPPRRQYPRGRWGDSICDWPQNMYPSCYCVCFVCCGMYLAAQSKKVQKISNYFY